MVVELTLRRDSTSLTRNKAFLSVQRLRMRGPGIGELTFALPSGFVDCVFGLPLFCVHGGLLNAFTDYIREGCLACLYKLMAERAR